MEGLKLKCDGYSTVKYLMEKYPELNEFLKPMAKINENAVLYPCYGICSGVEGQSDNYVIRFMGKNQCPLIAIQNDTHTEWFSAVTRKAPINEIDINTLYEFKE